MSKLTREKMVKYLDEEIEAYTKSAKEDWMCRDRDLAETSVFQAIREALTEKPRVSKMEFDIAATLAIVALDKLPKSEHYKILKSMMKQLNIEVSDVSTSDKEVE